MVKNITNKIKNLLIILLCITPSMSWSDKSPTVEMLEKSDLYFTVDIDLNGDKLLDKVISSKKNEGSKLNFFIKQGDKYHYALQSSNFTEDGGNILKEIKSEKQHGEILSISTYFPSGGNLTAQHFITFKENDWFLTRTVYETIYWQKDSSKIYVCNVAQDIRLQDLGEDGSGWKKFNHLPNKNRDKLCVIKTAN